MLIHARTPRSSPTAAKLNCSEIMANCRAGYCSDENDQVGEGDEIAKMSQLNWSPPTEAPEAIIQEGPLFAPGLRDGLIKIINQLDPASFVKFAETCKYIRDFCYDTHGIEVEFGHYDSRHSYHNCLCRVIIYVQVGSKTNTRMVLKLNSGGIIHYHTLLARELEILLKSPFIFTIAELFFVPDFDKEIDSLAFVKFSKYLRRFYRIRLGKIDTASVHDWNGFAGFINEFGAKDVQIGESWRHEIIPVDILPIFMNKVEKFEYYGYVPDDLILSANSKCMNLPNALISKETLKELIKRFRDGVVHNWVIGLSMIFHDLPFDDEGEEDYDDDAFEEDDFDEEHDELDEDEEFENGEDHGIEDEESEGEFDDEDEDKEYEFDKDDPFVKACSEVMEVVHVENISKLDMRQSVIYITSINFHRMCSLLKSDGSIGMFFVDGGAVVFRGE